MTDDELDRALFALPLEEPPADMHQRIMSATVLRAAPAFRQWELVLLAVVLGLVCVATAWIVTSSPDTGARLGDSIVAFMRGFGLFSRSTYVWLAIGLSSVWWISSLPFMASPRPTVYNR
jgi:1,4-dihydroxy-2-naphthoate octaprenyltransferase